MRWLVVVMTMAATGGAHAEPAPEVRLDLCLRDGKHCP
jgi:hypothetical protein